jgi:hypothetical protein
LKVWVWDKGFGLYELGVEVYELFFWAHDLGFGILALGKGLGICDIFVRFVRV